MEGIRIDVTSAAIGLALGATAGGLAAYLLSRRHFNAALAVETEALKTHYRGQIDKISADAAEHVPLGDTVPYPGKMGYEERLADEIAKISLGDDQGDDDLRDMEPAEPEGDRVAGMLLAWPPANRDKSRPYVISLEEFTENCDAVHQQLTITWYLGDSVLVDDKEKPIRDIRNTVGPLAREGFGGVSHDPNIRYVRNERLELDFEICIDNRAYADAVLNYGNPNRANDE